MVYVTSCVCGGVCVCQAQGHHSPANMKPPPITTRSHLSWSLSGYRSVTSHTSAVAAGRCQSREYLIRLWKSSALKENGCTYTYTVWQLISMLTRYQKVTVTWLLVKRAAVTAVLRMLAWDCTSYDCLGFYFLVPDFCDCKTR